MTEYLSENEATFVINTLHLEKGRCYDGDLITIPKLERVFRVIP